MVISNTKRNQTMTMMIQNLVFLVMLALALFVHVGDAWTVQRGMTSTSPLSTLSTSMSSSTRLYGQRRTKRGSLGTLAKEGLLDPDAKINKTKRSSSSSSSSSKKNKGTQGKVNAKKTNNNNSGISPALAEWMEKSSSSQGDNVVSPPSTTATATVTATESTSPSFEDFTEDEDNKNNNNNNSNKNKKKKKNKNSSSDRRMKQSQRSQMDQERAKLVQAKVDDLQKTLQKKNNLQDILTQVEGLLQLQQEQEQRQVSASERTASLRRLLQGKRNDYRLAWVGSDDAITHVGTGLHKVPLARLQEVFLSCLGKNRIEILEIIRILGPFPNVRNTLQGTTKVTTSLASSSSSSSLFSDLQITMDSMIDGTGKEILAGTEDNIRRVPLQIHFADERVIVAVVPPPPSSSSSSSTTDEKANENVIIVNPLRDNGSQVLVFLQEKELDEKLDALRVS